MLTWCNFVAPIDLFICLPGWRPQEDKVTSMSPCLVRAVNEWMNE